jgi:hypothetical protein
VVAATQIIGSGRAGGKKDVLAFAGLHDDFGVFAIEHLPINTVAYDGEISPIGTLMKKIQCQEKLSVIQPPIVGPTVGATITATP